MYWRIANLLFLIIWAPPLLAAEPKPDVLFIVADDLRADVMSGYDGPVPTPNLDKLAARGVRFTGATCGYPICHVSRSEMLSGRCLVAEASAGKAIPFAAEWQLWPDVMKRAGWHTVHSGKWHVQGTPWTRGYAETAGLFSGGGASGKPLTFPQSATGREVTGYKGWTFKSHDNAPLPDLGVGLTPETDERITDAAIEAIRKKSAGPQFWHVNFTAPHDPLHWPSGTVKRRKPDEVKLPANFAARHPFDHGNEQGRDELIVPAPRSSADVQRELAVYYGLVEHIDVQVGRLITALEESGRLESTIIIFTSDQGLALGSHGLMGKQNQYEHTANTPLIMAGPGIPAGRRLAAQCALRDIYPTVCELAGIAIPASVQGKSLVPVMERETTEVHKAVYGYFTDTQRMLRSPDGWKLIWYPKANRTQLFHIARDNFEVRDRSSEPEHQERVEQMMKSLKVWLRKQGDPLGNS